jgi:hypothetical protein
MLLGSRFLNLKDIKYYEITKKHVFVAKKCVPFLFLFVVCWHHNNKKPDLGKIILKVISDQIKIIFSKKDLKSDQNHIKSPLFEGQNFKKDKTVYMLVPYSEENSSICNKEQW